MKLSHDYRSSFIAAVLIHISIVLLFLIDPHHDRPVLKAETQNQPGQTVVDQTQQAQTVIKAVSVDAQEVAQTMIRLKAERAHQQQVELNRQRLLKQQAERARQERLDAQRRVEQLKRQAEQMAIERKKQLHEQQEHLKQLAEQKKIQEKQLAEMKKQQAAIEKQRMLEAKKLADLKQKKLAELAKAAAEREAQAKADIIKKQQAAAQQAAENAAKAARLAGEVDKYKALIINAISQQWILPENVDRSLSSQFRIRLAPNGAVLEVNLTRSSGDPILDRSAQAAIYKASPLPVPADTTTFNLFRDISLTVRPINARG